MIKGIQPPQQPTRAQTIVNNVSDTVFKPVDYINSLITDLQNAKIQNKKVEQRKSSIKSAALKVKNHVVWFHQKVAQKSALYSGHVETGVTKFTKIALTPLKIFHVTDAIRESISQKVGAIARVIIFCVMQIFHSIPYIIPAALLAGSIFLYHTAPVALLSFIGGSILLVQLYFMYSISVGMDKTKEILATEALLLNQRFEALQESLEKKGDQIDETINKSAVRMNRTLGSINPFNWPNRFFSIFRKSS